MIASAIIAKGQATAKYQLSKEFINKSILPVSIDFLNQCQGYCAVTSFLKALYEDFDVDRAASCIAAFDAQIKDDVLLKGIAADLKKNATILLSVVKSKLYGSVDTAKLENGATADDIIRVLESEGHHGQVSEAQLSSNKAAARDPKTVLHNQAFNLF